MAQTGLSVMFSYQADLYVLSASLCFTTLQVITTCWLLGMSVKLIFREHFAHYCIAICYTTFRRCYIILNDLMLVFIGCLPYKLIFFLTV